MKIIHVYNHTNYEFYTNNMRLWKFYNAQKYSTLSIYNQFWFQTTLVADENIYKQWNITCKPQNPLGIVIYIKGRNIRVIKAIKTIWTQMIQRPPILVTVISSVYIIALNVPLYRQFDSIGSWEMRTVVFLSLRMYKTIIE